MLHAVPISFTGCGPLLDIKKVCGFSGLALALVFDFPLLTRFRFVLAGWDGMDTHSVGYGARQCMSSS